MKSAACQRVAACLLGRVCACLGMVLGMMLVPAWGESLVRSRVSEGNAAYERGEYDAALEAYDDAAVEAPGSPHIAFNQGAVHYSREEFAAARERFLEAARNSPDAAFEAKARYNLGNAWFREAQRQRDSDLEKAVEACKASIEEYRRSLELAPENARAARNIEVVRLTMKTIFDQQQKQEEQGQEAQQAADDLKELAQRQETAAEKGRRLAEQNPQDPQQSQDLAAEQQQIRQDTQQAANALKQQQQQADGADATADDALNETTRLLDRATEHQRRAEEHLNGKKLDAAAQNQQIAADTLKEAVKRMQDAAEKNPQGKKDAAEEDGEQRADDKEQSATGEDAQQQSEDAAQTAKPDQDKQQSGDDEQDAAGKQDDEGGEESRRQEQADSAAQAGNAEDNNPESAEQEQLAVPAEKVARDILQQEKSRRERQQVREAGGIAPVDKDW